MNAAYLVLPLLLAGACAPRHPTPVTMSPVEGTSRPGARAETWRVQLALATSLLEHGNANAALALIATVRATGGQGVEIDVLEGRALRKAGLVDAAESLLVSVARRYPSRGEAWNDLGILAMERRDFPAAVERFERAVRREPRRADYADNLGFSLLAAGRAPEAVVALQRALEQNGASPRVRANLAIALVACDRDAEARRLLSAGGDRVEAFVLLGAALELRGDEPAALAAYREGLALDPTHPGIASAIAQLESP
ncbi:hypothetical protein LBMAG42_21530 [Deltaproteobacteria bacterium]|nr:hypothetical protein LBMAG42_21530 [Deltaproteobacteria bacterium]